MIHIHDNCASITLYDTKWLVDRFRIHLMWMEFNHGWWVSVLSKVGFEHDWVATHARSMRAHAFRMVHLVTQILATALVRRNT